MKRRELVLGLSACAAAPAVAGLFKASNMSEGQTFRKDAPGTLWKWSKEAYHYEKISGKTKCLICPNHCELNPGDRSACRDRVNIDGTAYTVAYGNPCAVNIDPIEKKPLFHFYPQSSAFSIATAGCNLRCLNCQNWDISQKKPEELSHFDLFPDQVVSAAQKNGCASIAYTYSEPTAFYEYMFDTAKAARGQGIKNVWISNGYMSRTALEPLCQYIDAANINIKAFTEETYNELNGGHLKPVLETLKTLRDNNVWFEMTTLMVPTYTDNVEMVKRISDWILKNVGADYPYHLSRFHPEHKLKHLPPTAIDKLVDARAAAVSMGIHYVFVGNAPGVNLEDTICPSCKKTVIGRTGFSVTEFKITKKGACAWCGNKIAGLFGPA